MAVSSLRRGSIRRPELAHAAKTRFGRSASRVARFCGAIDTTRRRHCGCRCMRSELRETAAMPLYRNRAVRARRSQADFKPRRSFPLGGCSQGTGRPAQAWSDARDDGTRTDWRQLIKLDLGEFRTRQQEHESSHVTKPAGHARPTQLQIARQSARCIDRWSKRTIKGCSEEQTTRCRSLDP